MPRPESSSVLSAPRLLSSSFDDLGVTRGTDGVSTLRVWSGSADAMELVVFDDTDLDWAVATLPMTPLDGDVWSVTTELLHTGARYALRADGPGGLGNAVAPRSLLLDPYGRGLASGRFGEWRSVVVDGGFDWGGVGKPSIPLDRTVVYEGHVKGMTKRHPGVPPALHGTYAGLAHPEMIAHFHALGVTSIELLPVHAFATEPRLLQHGLSNYWGYNTLNFFTPHEDYATAQSRREGPEAVLREFKGMVKLLHEAGLEVILDVVYNHTAEEGVGGPRTSLRGIDDRAYYRQTAEGEYIDVTGCGNAVDTSTDAAARLVLDSLRYWARDVQIDGFRFDLGAMLGRDDSHEFTPHHPLLEAIVADESLADVKKIVEPWDVGLGGWQTGNFGTGWSEWNDRYRDRVRSFWLSDIDHARRTGAAPTGIGGFATRLAGSSNTFSAERGPLASVNFVTAHDGFTLADLVSYDVKHNLANREENRDGTDDNRSFNHGAEGRTDDERILATRRKAMRNLLGTLLLSAGVPMIAAGDEFARSQQGNNNAYCQDSPLTWLGWEHATWQEDLFAHVRRLIRIRHDNPALRPTRFARTEEVIPSASVMTWFDARGKPMSAHAWSDPESRTLQYFATSTPEAEALNRILLVVHGSEQPKDVVLPQHEGVQRYVSLWSSADERPLREEHAHEPGTVFPLAGTSMHLFRAE